MRTYLLALFKSFGGALLQDLRRIEHASRGGATKQPNSNYN